MVGQFWLSFILKRLTAITTVLTTIVHGLTDLMILVGWAVLAALCAGGATLLFLVAALARIIVRSSNVITNSNIIMMTMSHQVKKKHGSWKKRQNFGMKKSWNQVHIHHHHHQFIIMTHHHSLSGNMSWCHLCATSDMMSLRQISVYCLTADICKICKGLNIKLYDECVVRMGDLEQWASAAEPHFYQFHQYCRSHTTLFSQFSF